MLLIITKSLFSVKIYSKHYIMLCKLRYFLNELIRSLFGVVQHDINKGEFYGH